MKSALFLTAIMFAGAAAAQTTTYESTTTTTTTATAPVIAAGGQTVEPSNANPERDARGIAVISAPAVVPAGFNNPPGMGGPLVDTSQPPAPMPAAGPLPACSRTITDHCVQTYERHRSR